MIKSGRRFVSTYIGNLFEVFNSYVKSRCIIITESINIMSKNYVCTLLIGSGLGSTILGVVFALTYLKKKNITTCLKVNVNFASSTGKVFFKQLKVIDDIEIIDLPVLAAKVNDVDHVITPSLNGEELFYSPGMEGHTLFETDFDLLKDVFTDFWSKLDLFSYNVSDYTCLHIRRGDKLIYEPSLKVHAIDTYIEELETQQLVNPVLIITDEYTTFLDFKEKWDKSEVTTTATSENKGFNITTINSESPDKVVTEVDNLLRDLNHIYNSSYFIGTQSSCVSLIGRLIVDKNKITILQ